MGWLRLVGHTVCKRAQWQKRRIFCKRALWQRRYFTTGTYHLKEPTNRRHPIQLFCTKWQCCWLEFTAWGDKLLHKETIVPVIASQLRKSVRDCAVFVVLALQWRWLALEWLWLTFQVEWRWQVKILKSQHANYSNYGIKWLKVTVYSDDSADFKVLYKATIYCIQRQ